MLKVERFAGYAHEVIESIKEWLHSPGNIEIEFITQSECSLGMQTSLTICIWYREATP